MIFINTNLKTAKFYPWQAKQTNNKDEAKVIINFFDTEQICNFSLNAKHFYVEVFGDDNYENQVEFLKNFTETHKEFVVFSNGLSKKLSNYLQTNLLNAKVIPASKYFGSKIVYNYPAVSFCNEPAYTVFKLYAQNTGAISYLQNNKLHISPINNSSRSLLYSIMLGEEFLNIKPSMQLSDFAYIYDDYMQHVNYKQWVDLLLKIYNKSNSNRPKNVLELACGTATVACELTKRGLTVDASDISTEMLVNSIDKPNINNVWQSCMTQKLNSSYDLIVLLFDSINYLHQKSQLKHLFENVKNGLNDSGVFIFDISTAKNCQENFDGFIDFSENKNGTYLQTATYNFNDNTQENAFIFYHQSGIFNVKSEEKVVQKIYPVSFYKKLISECGLKLTGIYSTNSTKNLMDKNPDNLEKNFYRLFFSVQK